VRPALAVQPTIWRAAWADPTVVRRRQRGRGPRACCPRPRRHRGPQVDAGLGRLAERDDW